MLPIKFYQPRSWKFGLALLTLAISLLACGNGLPLPLRTPTPTQPALLINFEVTVILPTPTPTATALPLPTATPVPATETPAPELPPTPTLTPIGGSSPINPTPTAVPPLEPITSTASITPTVSWEFSGINLLEPPDSFGLPAETIAAEFKWQWGQGCEPLPEGQGFEVRVWPDLPGYSPMGVMDAAANQKDVACEPKSGTRSYRVSSLRDAAGVKQTGFGRFRWDVALVQLQPYAPLTASGSRVFDLPPDPSQPTPTPSPIPRVTLASGEPLGGTISLFEIQDGFTLPEDAKKVEFKWNWSQANATCLALPEGYGFEVRVWPDRPDFGPMGAMGDARQSQKDIFCDGSNGLRGYLVLDIKQTPAVATAGAGRFRWDVVLVQLEPYTILTQSESRTFNLPGVSKLP